MNNGVSNQKISIVRFPHGVWAAVAALPIGTRVYTVMELEDERPFRYEAWRRVAPSLGPIVSRPSVALAGVPGREKMWRAIQGAKAAADAMADREVRDRLMKKMAVKIQNAARLAEHVYRSTNTSIGLVDQNSRLHVAVGELLARISYGDQEAISIALEMAQRQNFDRRAATFVRELVQHASLTPVGRRLAAVYHQAGFGALAQAIIQKSAGA